MKTKADTLDKILDDYALDECRKIYPAPDKNKFRERIIAIFKECVPEEKNFMSEVCMWRDDADMIKQIRGEVEGHKKCREETLKNIEELR